MRLSTALGRRIAPLLLLASLAFGETAKPAIPAKTADGTFSAMIYNVENLHDIDGQADYEDFQGDKYTARHLLVKITNIATILSKVDQGAGPAVVAFNEIERDHTPQSTVKDYDKWLASVADTTAEKMLSGPVTPELAGLPAEAWLLKACVDAGLTGYHVAVTTGETGSVRNVLFSRFPVTEVRTHPSQDARAVLEATLNVDGHPFTVFVNHWKSMRGTKPSDTEAVRRQNAGVLRKRIDQLLADDANADFLVVGDLNTNYNQKQRERGVGGPFAVNDVLGSQGNELAVRGKKRDLYNLWFELPSDQRGSDEFDGAWGTLIQMIVSRGLYDYNGVQYVDNSFAVVKIPGLNVNGIGRPNRFSRGKTPYGFSDHFPLVARFRVTDKNARDRWIALIRPSETENGPAAPVPATIDTRGIFAGATKLSSLAQPEAILEDGQLGKIFYVESPATVSDRGFVRVKVGERELDVFSHNKALRDKIAETVRDKGRLRFYGELGTFQDRWQFLLWGPEWIR